MPNFESLEAVIAFAAKMAKDHPKFPQFVVKHPGRTNYNITMQLQKALNEGYTLIWSSI